MYQLRNQRIKFDWNRLMKYIIMGILFISMELSVSVKNQIIKFDWNRMMKYIIMGILLVCNSLYQVKN